MVVILMQQILMQLRKDVFTYTLTDGTATSTAHNYYN